MAAGGTEDTGRGGEHHPLAGGCDLPPRLRVSDHPSGALAGSTAAAGVAWSLSGARPLRRQRLDRAPRVRRYGASDNSPHAGFDTLVRSLPSTRAAHLAMPHCSIHAIGASAELVESGHAPSSPGSRRSCPLTGGTCRTASLSAGHASRAGARVQGRPDSLVASGLVSQAGGGLLLVPEVRASLRTAGSGVSLRGAARAQTYGSRKDRTGGTRRWGVAPRTLNGRRVLPPKGTSAWGRAMLARQGGLAVQRRYRATGRHPTEAATRARRSRRPRGRQP